MSKPSKPGTRRRIATSIMSRESLRNAAATALLVTAPYLFAAPAATQTTLAVVAPSSGRKLERATEEPVVDLLSVPLDAEAADSAVALAMISETATGSDPISVTNTDEQGVGADESAIELHGDTGHVSLLNSGNLTGGTGIDISTGVLDTGDSQIVNTTDESFINRYYSSIYNDDGSPVQEPCSWDPNYACNVSVNTGNVITRYVTRDHNAAQSDAAITIDNTGGIDFSGIYGIRTENLAGASIDISSSGDIASTQDTARRVGIYANTASDFYSRVSEGPNVVTPGAYTYVYVEDENGDIQKKLKEVVTIGEHEKIVTRDRLAGDLGSIRIENSGSIDMGAVDVSEIPPGYRPAYTQSEGITAVGMGGVEILNRASGTIKVGDFSRGITVVSGGDASITNDGRIEIGNQSYGIYSAGEPPLAPYQMGDAYLHSGDTSIVNTGDIVGGMTRAEAEASANAFGESQPAGVVGIRAFSLGTNRDGYGARLHGAATAAYYVAELTRLGLDPGVVQVPDLSSYTELKNYTTTLVNEGNIELKDGALGIYGTAVYGEMRAINSGTITLGNGRSVFESNAENHASGIYLNNHTVEGWANFYAKNTADGVIVTGDDGAGIQIQSFRGNATAVNEGSITTGDGGIGPHYNYVLEKDFDWLFPSVGLSVSTFGATTGQKASARNSGNITVGAQSIGVQVSGRTFNYLSYLPYRVSGELLNEGAVTGGKNSAGLVASGNNVAITNTGTVTIGSRDLSGFNPDPDPDSATAFNFGLLGHGIYSRAYKIGVVQNDGIVTTGDNTVGIFNTNQTSYGRGTYTVQGEDGSVVTGDHSIGIRNHAGYVTGLENAGSVVVGDDSVGIDMSAGFVGIRFLSSAEMPALAVVPGVVQAINAGIVETGDNSVGVRLAGFIDDLAYEGKSYYVTSQDPFEGEYRYYDGTVDVAGYSLLQNTGTIRVGANSTAVELSGQGVEGRILLNAGLIDAGADASSLALDVNTGNDLDSQVVNVGTIVGNILFGSGDDTLTNTTVDNLSGTSGAGNLVMQGTRIDFGAGNNRLVMDQGAVTIFGTGNLITGADLSLTYAWFDAQNLALGDALTIDGNITGDLRFGTDLDASGASDKLLISGDVADGSSIGVQINPTAQLSGELSFNPIVIEGHNGAEFEFAGASGAFADTVHDAVVEFDESTGEVIVHAQVGMGHMAMTAASATTLAHNWWRQSVGTTGQRNVRTLAGSDDAGLSFWGGVFQQEGDIDPDSGAQDASFTQLLSGMQTGLRWTGAVGKGQLSVSPMLSFGDAEANLNANRSSANGDALGYGLDASYRFAGGFYLNAVWQAIEMDLDLKTPQAATDASGSTEASGQGFDLELGYARALDSGLTLVPQFQYSFVDMDVDDFSSSDGIHRLSDIGGESTALRAGLSVLKTIETRNGSITPLAGISYVDMTEGDSSLRSNGVAFSTDSSGSGYLAELGLSGRYKDWDIGARFNYADSDVATSDITMNLTVRWNL